MRNTQIRAEEDVTVDQLCAMAAKMWKDKKAGATLEVLHRDYKQFSQAYPIVTRLIAVGEYDARSFREWIERVAKKPWTTEKEFIERAAEYPAIIRRRTRGATAAELGAIRREYVESLTAETEEFKAAAKKAEEVLNKREEADKAILKDELYNFIVAGTN